jgi:hypothetical protein
VSEASRRWSKKLHRGIDVEAQVYQGSSWLKNGFTMINSESKVGNSCNNLRGWEIGSEEEPIVHVRDHGNAESAVKISGDHG